MNVETTLGSRGLTYGAFKGHASISQDLKSTMHDAEKWDELSADKKEALEMIVHEVARILNGDPEYHDSWHDIQGYAKIVASTLTTD